MRARISCPRSSVPNGWASEGPSRRALKSMSLMLTRQTKGPNVTATIRTIRRTPLTTASLGRGWPRQVSRQGDQAGRGSAEGDARVKPAIKDIRDEIEEH